MDAPWRGASGLLSCRHQVRQERQAVRPVLGWVSEPASRAGGPKGQMVMGAAGSARAFQAMLHGSQGHERHVRSRMQAVSDPEGDG
jgi:predicted metal-dependent HD superfamily phosphohydrolase